MNICNMTEEELAKEQSNIKEGSRVKTLKMISVAGDPVRKFRDGVVKKITGDMISVDFGSGNLVECDRKNLRLNSRAISSNRVVANAVAARACNAKFKIGDKVKWNFGGGVMTVVDKNGTDYLCRDSKGQEVVYSEDKLIAANAVANAVAARACNAKFKIGDKVKWNFGGGVMTVVDKNGTDYLCRDSKGQEVVYSEDKLIAANAVANAVAARACNAATVEEQRKALADLPKFKALVDKTIAEHKAVVDTIESCIAPSKALQQKIEEVKSKLGKVTKDGQKFIENVPDSLFQARDLPDVKKEIKRYYECFRYDGPVHESRNKLRKILNDMWNAL